MITSDKDNKIKAVELMSSLMMPNGFFVLLTDFLTINLGSLSFFS